ncbi:hypothetical protein [Tuberibacillus sp. Marseille-P3662]|nr:hypothetical protein [Tuberibacillus sp. Marseille-P3662]
MSRSKQRKGRQSLKDWLKKQLGRWQQPNDKKSPAPQSKNTA